MPIYKCNPTSDLLYIIITYIYSSIVQNKPMRIGTHFPHFTEVEIGKLRPREIKNPPQVHTLSK